MSKLFVRCNRPASRAAMSPHKHCSFVCVLPTWYIVKGSDRWQNITPYVSMSGSWATWRLAADEVIFHLLWVSLWLCVRLCRSHLKRMNHQTNKKKGLHVPAQARTHTHIHERLRACVRAHKHTRVLNKKKRGSYGDPISLVKSQGRHNLSRSISKLDHYGHCKNIGILLRF